MTTNARTRRRHEQEDKKTVRIFYIPSRPARSAKFADAARRRLARRPNEEPPDTTAILGMRQTPQQFSKCTAPFTSLLTHPLLRHPRTSCTTRATIGHRTPLLPSHLPIH